MRKVDHDELRGGERIPQCPTTGATAATNIHDARGTGWFLLVRGFPRVLSSKFNDYAWHSPSARLGRQQSAATTGEPIGLGVEVTPDACWVQERIRVKIAHLKVFPRRSLDAPLAPRLRWLADRSSYSGAAWREETRPSERICWMTATCWETRNMSRCLKQSAMILACAPVPAILSNR